MTAAGSAGGRGGLQGRTLPGGPATRAHFARLLGIEAAPIIGRTRVVAVAWAGDHVEIEVAGPGSQSVVFYVDRFQVKAPSLDARLENLSGGNQQKISLAKSLDTEPRILIVDEPTRGVDVKAKSDIYAFIRELADRGIAVLFISSELEEIIGMCERVIVMREGRAVGELAGDGINEEEIMYYATGIKGGL